MSKKMGRPTRPLDWVLWFFVSLHNMFYVITNTIDGAVTLIDNQIRHQDDAEIAWQEFTIDLETLDSKEE